MTMLFSNLALVRRSLLRASLFGAGASLVLPGRLLLARAPTDQRFVLLILRGALDGLAAVPPYGDRDYRAVRGVLALPEPGEEKGIVDLDGQFGLHPNLAALAPWYAEGSLLAVQAVASPYRERSHFDGQDLLENGTDNAGGTTNGWLNRTLGLLGPGDAQTAVAFTEGTPLVLRGPVPVGSWTPDNGTALDPHFFELVGRLYGDDAALAQAFTVGLETTEYGKQVTADMTAAGVAEDRRQPKAGDADTDLARTAGRFLSREDGSRIAVLELTGWDTHSGQGSTDGRLGKLLTGLAETLAALREGLGDAWGRTVIVTVTEFGRTAAPNGAGGTDHGTASMALLTGGAVLGGRVVADWPGLATDRLYQGRDLAPTTDLRAVLKGVLRDHLSLPEDALNRVVFPGSGEVAPLREIVRTA
jgi:uncharacterized protein (DUF1501 family)